jgi:hypothetical protein
MYQNPYQFMGSQAAMNPYQSMMTPAAPQMQVTKVNGAGGANAFSMGPNSSALLLDASGTMIWAVTTDGAGYKTVAAYDIVPHKSEEAITYEGLESRIKRLEEMINDRSVEENKRGSNAGKSEIAAVKTDIEHGKGGA